MREFPLKSLHETLSNESDNCASSSCHSNADENVFSRHDQIGADLCKSVQSCSNPFKPVCNLKLHSYVDVIYKNEEGKTFVIKCQPVHENEGNNNKHERKTDGDVECDGDGNIRTNLSIKVYQLVKKNTGVVKVKVLNNGNRIFVTPNCPNKISSISFPRDNGTLGTQCANCRVTDTQ